MKNVVYSFLIICLFLSCKNSTKPVANNTRDLIQKFSPSFRGVWVKKDYIDMVVKTGSPSAARNAAHDMTMMYLSADSIKGDSIMVPAILQNHYPSRLVLKFKEAKPDSALSFANRMDLSNSVEKGDTILTFTYFNDYLKQTITTKFIRALNKQPAEGLNYGMGYAINKVLLTGSYSLAGTTNKVNFTNGGKVSGFLNYTRYKIRFDFESGPMNNMDEMELYSDPGHYVIYTFKISGNALTLYEVSPNAGSTVLVMGKLAYKLVREK